jgi:phosphinothricin acetyltransferase
VLALDGRKPPRAARGGACGLRHDARPAKYAGAHFSALKRILDREERTIPAEPLQLRPASPADFPAIQAIYAHYVLHGLASFEEVPPALDELRRRHDERMGRGLPWLVADLAGAVAGYGYCSHYHARSGYRYTLEDSIYVRQDAHGKGVGSAILRELIVRCEALGYRQLVAIIGDSGNAASIKLHARQGFVRAGMLRSVGFKFGRWVDSVVMQRPLGPGDASSP